MHYDLLLCNGTNTTTLSNAVSTQVIVLLVLDTLVAISTIIGNTLFMVTLCMDRSLHVPSNVLLGLLCTSDLLVGYICQALFMAHLLQLVTEYKVGETLLDLLFIVVYKCSGASFVFTSLVSIDRYLAICHPFKYHAKATCSKHLILGIVIGGLWTLTFGSINFVQYDILVNSSINVTYMLIATLSIIFSYASIYRVTRKQRNTVISIGRISREEIGTVTRKSREKAKTKTVGIIIGFLFICYGPLLITKIMGILEPSFCWNSAANYSKMMWVTFCILLNSLMNPIVYFVRSKRLTASLRRKVLPCYKQRIETI